jgi:hypothetical protein
MIFFQVVNGYFVHFFAPDIQEAIPKDVLFVIDKSDSMFIRKIEQLKVSTVQRILYKCRGRKYNSLKKVMCKECYAVSEHNTRAENM